MAVTTLTPKQQHYRKALLGKIHSAPMYIALYKDDRPAWEHMLQRAFGVTSSAKLTIKQLLNLLDFLQGNNRYAGEYITDNQIRYIRHVWQQKAHHKDEKHLLAFARRTCQATPISLSLLTRHQASGLIAAIKRL